MVLNFKFCGIPILILAVVCFVTGAHTPSPHRFECPSKKSTGALKDIIACGTKFKFMLDHVYGFQSDLIMNLVKHVFFHALKCIDEDYEHFLMDGAVDCFVGDNKPGAKMLCNVKTSVCDSGLQGEMAACAVGAVKAHKIDFAKMLSQLGHLSKLCQLLADGTHRQCKAKWKDFPALPVK